jgi:hypothetical protein
MSDHNALLHRIVRDLAHASPALIDNVLVNIVDAQNSLHAAQSFATSNLSITSDVMFADSRKHLDRAAQRLWGAYPPEGVRVDDSWHYTVNTQ